MKMIANWLLAGIILAFCCPVGNAQIIYADDSTSGAEVIMNGTTSTEANHLAGGTNTATWRDALLTAHSLGRPFCSDAAILPLFDGRSDDLMMLSGSSIDLRNWRVQQMR